MKESELSHLSREFRYCGIIHSPRTLSPLVLLEILEIWKSAELDLLRGCPFSLNPVEGEGRMRYKHLEWTSLCIV